MNNRVSGRTEERLTKAIDSSTAYLLREYVPCDEDDRRLPDSAPSDLGYWHGELEADSTLESDYILFLYYLDPEGNREKIRKLANRVMLLQLEDGSWNTYYGGPGDVSASVKAYFALKLVGVSTTDPIMVKARDAILAMGGVDQVNTFTKIYLSFLKQYDWKDCPAIPPEIVLLPRFFYLNIYEISYWSRAILVPLSILFDRRPHRVVPPEAHIHEIFANGNGNGVSGNGNGAHAVRSGNGVSGNGNGHAKTRRGRRFFGGNGFGSNGNGRARRVAAIPRDPNLFSWKNAFLLIDRLLKIIERTPVKPLRSMAVKRAEKWMVQRFEKSDGLGAIFPSMVNSVIALHSLGYDVEHPHIANSLAKLRELEIDEGDSIRLQPCLSPVWDTALALNALGEAGLPRRHARGVNAARWLVEKEAQEPGDWKLRRPKVETGGWYFQFNNEFYPDVDDTAGVLMALERFELDEDGEAALKRGLHWVLSMQCSDGGWAAFDVDVDREILTQVPFADHNAMLDPACADITGRVLEALGRFPELRDDPRVEKAIDRGIEFLRRAQEPSGTWYGRWGVNYIYGTWQSLKGLASVGVKPDDPMIRRAVDWLKSVQNDDGGWGESCRTYEDPSTAGQGKSTASQTAWALMGLIAGGETDSPDVSRGVDYLIETQSDDGTWTELEFTGTGFPRVFYLRYHLYCQYFPLFALASYRNACTGRTPPQGRKEIVLADPRPAGRRAAEKVGGNSNRLRGGDGLERDFSRPHREIVPEEQV